jgi:hypothetical protein
MSRSSGGAYLNGLARRRRGAVQQNAARVRGEGREAMKGMTLAKDEVVWRCGRMFIRRALSRGYAGENSPTHITDE